MKHYRYIHFLWANELKFNEPLVKMFTKLENGFDMDEVLFVTPNQYVFDSLSNFGHFVLEKGRTASEIINEYANYCDWFFSHGIPNKIETLKIKRRFFKKAIWRTWGGSRTKSHWDKYHPIDSLINKMKDGLYYLFYRYTYGCSPAIGIANVVDEIDLAEWGWAKHTTLLKIGYAHEGILNMLEKAKLNAKHDGRLRVLVGHQGNPGERHVAIAKQLLSYEADFDIYVPLSYGNSLYIHEVLKELAVLDDKRIIPITDFMPFDSYLSLLASMDVAILDEVSSMALGNIAYLLYFHAKIFLNNKGVIAKAFDKEGVPYLSSSQLPLLSYNEFAAPVPYPSSLQTSMMAGSYDAGVNRWHQALAFLEGQRR